MTPRTPQCKVFWALLSNPKHSGVPEDSQVPNFRSVGSHPYTWPKWGCDTLGLQLVAPSVGKMCKKFSCQKICQAVNKSLCTHFFHFWFFSKIFMHNYICMWKITTTMKMIIIWIIQYVSLKFIPFKLYIWKIVKTKSLIESYVQKGLNVNMPCLRWHYWTLTFGS
jgi:hypothetical protein